MLSLPQQLTLKQKEIQSLKQNFIILAQQHQLQKQQNQQLKSIIHQQYHQLPLYCTNMNDTLQQRHTKIMSIVSELDDRLSSLNRKIPKMRQQIILLKHSQKRSKNHIKLLKQKIQLQNLNNQEISKLKTVIQEQKKTLNLQKLNEQKLILQKGLIQHELTEVSNQLTTLQTENSCLQAQKHRLEHDLTTAQQQYKIKLSEAINEYNSLYQSQLRQRAQIENLLNDTLKKKIQEMSVSHKQELSFMRRRIRTLESEEKPKSYRIHKCSFKKGYH